MDGKATSGSGEHDRKSRLRGSTEKMGLPVGHSRENPRKSEIWLGTMSAHQMVSLGIQPVSKGLRKEEMCLSLRSYRAALGSNEKGDIQERLYKL